MPADPIANIREDHARLYPDLETTGLAVTGRILRLAALLEDARDHRLADHDLSLGDFDVLATLRRRAGDDGVNPRDLQRAVMISSGGMTKRLDRLQDARLTRRHPDPDDRRAVRITLTDRGRDLIDQALPAVMNAETDLVVRAIADPDDRDRLASYLSELLAALESGPTDTTPSGK